MGVFLFKMTTSGKHNKSIMLFFRSAQLLSLDVVLGAIATGAYAVKLLNVSPNYWWWPVLALSVWIVYTTDHLIDSFSRKNNALIHRHKLHYRYRHVFVVAVTVSSVVVLSLVWFFLDKKILTGGLIIGIGAIIYLVLVGEGNRKNFSFQKEFFISLFYTAGIWLAPLVWNSKPLSPSVYGIIFVFIILVWIEGLVVAIYECDMDTKDKQMSFVTKFGISTSSTFIKILFGLTFVSSLVLLLFTNSIQEFSAVVIELFMAVALFSIYYFQNYFKHHELYKTLGEMIFWLPGILWFIT